MIRRFPARKINFVDFSLLKFCNFYISGKLYRDQGLPLRLTRDAPSRRVLVPAKKPSTKAEKTLILLSNIRRLQGQVYV